MSDVGPDIRAGTKFSDTSAADWRSLRSVAQAFRDIRCGAGLRCNMTGTGFSIGLDFESESALRHSATVVIRELHENFMLVRRAQYADVPPVVGRYSFAGDAFVAAPAVGFKTSDFEDFVWAEEDGPLSIETPFLQARFDNGFWLVALPAAAEMQQLIHPVVIRKGAGLLSVEVSRVEAREVPPDSGTFEDWAGSAIFIRSVWPGYTMNFLSSLSRNIPPSGEFKVDPSMFVCMEIFTENGFLVAQHVPFSVIEPSRSRKRADCSLI